MHQGRRRAGHARPEFRSWRAPADAGGQRPGVRRRGAEVGDEVGRA